MSAKEETEGGEELEEGVQTEKQEDEKEGHKENEKKNREHEDRIEDWAKEIVMQNRTKTCNFNMKRLCSWN
jgi:hypothetical protein